jgi:ATP-dependent exoDNAse (exonuclease V) alpha subunit
METMPHIAFTELKPFEGWTDSNIKALDAPQRWAGFHEERDIKDCKTAHIDEVDFTHRKYKMLPNLAELPEVALHRYNEITGAAGCSKTYTATHFNLWDVCMLVPTSALLVKFRDENPTMPCQTFHKAFNMNMKKGDYMPDRRQYSNYILDECSMICKGMFNVMLSDKNAKNANLMIIHDRAQLAAVMPDNSHWEDPKTRYFTYGKEYKARQWNKIHLTEQKRQNDPRFINILDRMREMQDQAGSLPHMVKLLEDRIITEEAARDLYRMDTKDIVIASTNEEVDRWNKMLLKQAKPNELKLKYTSTAKNYSYVNNERVIMQSEQLACQELAFAATVHIVQGITSTDRLFISLSLLKKGNNFDPHLLYTAVSRVKSIDNLYLVRV